MFARQRSRARKTLGRKGAVALATGLLAPAFLGVAALGVDVSYWSLDHIELQRTADLAATAGALHYASTSDNQAAARMAASVAQMNGATGATSGTWDAANKRLSDGQITVSIINGVRHSTNFAVQATIQQSAPLFFGRIFTNMASIPISATAIAEMGPNNSPQPCILALNGFGDGVTTQIDVSLSGNVNITMNGCTMRSNEAISLNGNVSLNSTGIYAGSTINSSGNVSITGPKFPNSGQIPDPYASNSDLQSAFSQLTTQTTRSFPGSGAATAGTYSSMNITGNTTLSAGLYIVTGDFSVSGNTAVTNAAGGGGVTIIVGGSVSINGNSNFNLTAPDTESAAVNGGIPGILIASNSTDGASINGNNSSAVSGVFYFPNSGVSFNGNGAINGQSNCLEVVAASVTITGNANMGGDCAKLGAAPFTSLPGGPVALVQ